MSPKDGIEKFLALPNLNRESVNLDDPEHQALDAAGYHYLLNDLAGGTVEDKIILETFGLKSMHDVLGAVPGIEYKTACAYDVDGERIAEKQGIVSFWVRRKGGK